MDGNGSAGNPSSASPRSLPACTLPTEADQQDMESVSLSTQKHQRPGENSETPRVLQRTEEELAAPTKTTNPLTDKPPTLSTSLATKAGQIKPDPFPTEPSQGNSCVTDTEETKSEQSSPNHPVKLESSGSQLKTGDQPEPDQKKQKHEQASHFAQHQTQKGPVLHTTQNRLEPPPDRTTEPRLCGFLQKQGGPLKAWKQRWFTYEEKKNQLFYYRTPQDVTPLGWVELTSATFTYPLRAESGTFHIRTPERTFILKVQPGSDLRQIRSDGSK